MDGGNNSRRTPRGDQVASPRGTRPGRPARENGVKTAKNPEHRYIHRCTTADAISKETDPSLRSFIDFPLLSFGIYIKQCLCQLSEDNKLPCEGNTLSYFKFVHETLTISGLRKALESDPSPETTSPNSSPPSSLVLVISRRIRSKHISNFVNFQPEEKHERRESTREEYTRVLRTPKGK